jgi:ketosteroid isomerase-like protein
VSSTSATTPRGAAPPEQPDLVARLMGLWSTPLPDDDAEALAAFRGIYTDPVEVNGTTMALDDLLARGRAMQRAYGGIGHRLIDRVDAPGRLVVAFHLLATHTGPLETPLGTVAATGRPVDVRVVDVLTLTGGRVSAITMVADELTALHRLGVLALADEAR